MTKSSQGGEDVTALLTVGMVVCNTVMVTGGLPEQEREGVETDFRGR